MSAFLDLYETLPRQGPGDRASLDFALLVVGVGRDQHILDAGCGTGADIEGLLAWAPQGHVTAVDTHAPFIEQIRSRHANDPRVTAIAASMADQSGPFDLIWSAGALYFLGLHDGLATMHERLAPSGTLVFSYPAYFTETPSAEARQFWEGEGEVLSESAVLDATRAAGFHVLDATRLPDAAWEAYYAPLHERILTMQSTANDEMKATLEEAQAEIDGWRAARRETGYLQIVAERQ